MNSVSSLLDNYLRITKHSKEFYLKVDGLFQALDHGFIFHSVIGAFKF